MPTNSAPTEIVGAISGATARIEVQLTGSATIPLEEVVVDTGFTGGLRVPRGFFARTGIRPNGLTEVSLPDDSEAICPIGLVTINWFGGAKRISAVEFGTEALLGMELLNHTRIELIEELVRLMPV